MKVIHAIYSFTVGGAETMLVDIINEQCKEASVYLLVINDKIDKELLSTINPNVEVILLHRKVGSKLGLIRCWVKLVILLRKIRPHIIHCHENNLLPLFYLWKKRTCTTVHNVGLSSVKYLQKYSQVFSISQSAASDLKKRGDINSKIVYNGILIDEYKQRSNYHASNTGEFNIIQISRLCPEQKGQDIAIKAISLLLKQVENSSIQLYFIGSGNALDELKNLVKEYHVENNIHFLGQKSRKWIKENLHNYHLLIQPSLHEAFGLTIIEGLASGLPVISSNLDGPKEIKEQINVGLLVNPNDEVDLAKKITLVKKAYKTNTVLQKKYAIENKTQLTIFNIKNTASNYLKYYKKEIV